MSPRLSVVVPVRHAGDELLDCLRSLAAQTMADLEVVLVGAPAAGAATDGTTDGTTEDGPAGSSPGPDAGGRLAARFAAGDPRFRLVREDCGGLGEARAAGLRHTDPDSGYLAFVTPSDTLPPDAYARLLGSLEETGSDLATGNVLRAGPDGPVQAEQFRRPMERTRQRTHITRHRALTQDRYIWNKVFRRAFWERHGFRWPDGPLREDTLVTLPAHYLAESVDVLGDHVYHWRERPGPQTGAAARTRTDLHALRDRLAVVDGVSLLLAEAGAGHRDGYGAQHGQEHGSGPGRGRRRTSRAAKRHYDQSVLTGELAPYLKALYRADEEFQGLFTALASDFVSRVDPAVLAALPVGTRMKWHLIRERRTADLLDALAFERENPRVFRMRGLRSGRAAFLHPDGREIPVPRRAARPRPADLPLVTRLREASWQPDGTLRLRGYAYVRSVDAGQARGSRKAAWLRQKGSRRRVPLRVRTVPAPEATRGSRQRLHSYDASGFEVTVDPSRLLSALGRSGTGTWTPVIAVFSGGLLRRGRIEAGGEGSGAQPQARELADGRRVVPAFRDGWLRLSVEQVTARLESHRADGDALELTCAVREGHRPVALRTGHRHPESAAGYPVVPAGGVPAGTGPAGDGWQRFTVRVPLAGPAARDGGAARHGEAGPAETGPVRLVLADGSSCRILAPQDTPPGRYPLGTGGPAAEPGELPDGVPGGASDGGVSDSGVSDGASGAATVGRAARELCLAPDASGHLVLSDRTGRPAADTLRWSADGELLLSGSCPGPAGEAVDLVWQHSRHREEVTVPVERDGDRFTARLRPASAAPGGLPLRQGRWFPFLRARGAERRDADLPLRLLPALHAALPARHEGDRAYTLERRAHDRLFLVSGSVLAPHEQGAFQQHRLSTVHYPAARSRPLRDAVLYNSFDGRQFSDSPRAVFEELRQRDTGIEHLWAVRDGQAVLPEGVRPVVLGSADWHEALARSRWLVGNTHFPRWFARREGQSTVQTWHGTPLKRIGLDLAGSSFANHDYLAGLAGRAAQWSLLLSPNRFSTPILRRAFGYRGEILESGYPRNDLLYSADRDKRAEEVRGRLGIPPGKRVVLYAPTWRDDSRFDRSNCKFDLRLELDVARAALGADHVLLVRKHYLVADAVPGTGGDGFVRDVSAWPDIAELLLVSDVLVTDYSSLMFDFAHTGRPMLFFTYDLERYRDVLRGFCFDFPARAPGPLLARSGEVIAALREVGTVAEEYGARYREFREAFCDLDDGRAAVRVVDRMLAAPEPAAAEPLEPAVPEPAAPEPRAVEPAAPQAPAAAPQPASGD